MPRDGGRGAGHDIAVTDPARGRAKHATAVHVAAVARFGVTRLAEGGGVRVKIHRGAHEIGGSCIELEADGARLVLDLGRPLAAGADAVVARPAVPGLERPDPSLVGLVITHPHLDHYGLAPGVASSVPVFMGEAAYRLLVAASFYTNAPVPPAPAGHLRHRVPFAVGPFTVTPFLADHSAFDAYSLLVEAGGRRLFYTGDFRGHGRKRALFEELLRMPPAGVDVLLMEGTNVRAGASAGAGAGAREETEHAHGRARSTSSSRSRRWRAAPAAWCSRCTRRRTSTAW